MLPSPSAVGARLIWSGHRARMWEKGLLATCYSCWLARWDRGTWLPRVYCGQSVTEIHQTDRQTSWSLAVCLLASCIRYTPPTLVPAVHVVRLIDHRNASSIANVTHSGLEYRTTSPRSVVGWLSLPRDAQRAKRSSIRTHRLNKIRAYHVYVSLESQGYWLTSFRTCCNCSQSHNAITIKWLLRFTYETYANVTYTLKYARIRFSSNSGIWRRSLIKRISKFVTCKCESNILCI